MYHYQTDVKKFCSVFAIFFLVLLQNITSTSQVVHAQEIAALPPLEVSELTQMSFGTFSVEKSGGSVAVDARSGACSLRGGAVMVNNFCERGQFEIRGLPESQVLVEVVAGSRTQEGMELRNITLYPQESHVVKLGLDGKARIQIGAELYATHPRQLSQFDANYMLSVSYLQ